MHYVTDGTEINVGDRVLVEKTIRGTVVCDFDRKTCLAGYEGWLSEEELVGGGTLASGIMVETKELGMVHYALEDDGIFRDET
jgi:hypothetical protein